MNHPALTYLVTTFNKLPFLRCALDNLLHNVRPDEDVLVIDGGSQDGTQDYLGHMAARDPRLRFVSEPDRGEAHGWNKGLLLASGHLIKLISDDDVFDYKAITKCREFMEQTPGIDVLWSDGAGVSLARGGSPVVASGVSDFDAWRRGRTLLFCCGLGLMIRRKSLPLVGLFNTSTRRIDGEFSLRLSAGSAQLAWYSGVVFVRIENNASIAMRMQRRMALEEVAFKLAYYILAGRRLRLPLRTLASTMFSRRGRRYRASVEMNDERIREIFSTTSTWLAERNNATDSGHFIIVR